MCAVSILMFTAHETVSLLTVALSHAVATAMVHGPEAGLELIDGLARDARIAGHYRLAAVRGHLLEKSGDIARAISCFRAAADGTASIPERNYLIAKAARLSPSCTA